MTSRGLFCEPEQELCVWCSTLVVCTLPFSEPRVSPRFCRQSSFGALGRDCRSAVLDCESGQCSFCGLLLAQAASQGAGRVASLLSPHCPSAPAFEK